jgi:membrane dipeptidase
MLFLDPDFSFGALHDPYTQRSRIDIPRMESGELDGIFLAVFVGQAERDDSGNISAKNEAIEVFDSIHANLERYKGKIELALRPEDVKPILRKEKKVAFIGLENGYPIGNDISLIDTFYNLGMRYITLCHTSNNDICDSSTDPKGPEHNGLSAFGEEVVQYMNRKGIMIDVSHISDSAFFDVINLSKAPVIASHSCARAVCDNPRNLSDEMLKKLSDNGGVIQMCILSAYVKTPVPQPRRDSAKAEVRKQYGNYYSLDKPGRKIFLDAWYRVDKAFPPELASVSDAVDHIDHIVKIAGIDHVGIGTDFDGGGGLTDCYDVSQIKNITAELIKRGYSEKDIEKIWGGNFLRVFREVNKVSQELSAK